ncbi:hypothetical protein [Mycolicibacterium sarraceniae]|uniref:hypothetical protein n=1 Tax=Mycolicibacterium sarraceniae TaxID=1534348 RepID=UPI0015D1AC9C
MAAEVEYLRVQDDRSGWDINTGAFSWFNNSGVAVVMRRDVELLHRPVSTRVR